MPRSETSKLKVKIVLYIVKLCLEIFYPLNFHLCCMGMSTHSWMTHVLSIFVSASLIGENSISRIS